MILYSNNDQLGMSELISNTQNLFSCTMSQNLNQMIQKYKYTYIHVITFFEL